MNSRLVCSLVSVLALTTTAACGCNPDTPARGAASATWSIAVLDNPATCAQVGAASVSLQLHNRERGEELTTTFSCSDAGGTSSPVPAGIYDATLTLHAADGATLAIAPTQAAVRIPAGQVAALRPAAFAVSDRGTLVLSLEVLGKRSNCSPPSQGGAGLTGTLLTLDRVGGGCAAVTFTRARGTTPLGTYTVDCTSPHVASCIERDETLAVDGLSSGPYSISVTGLVGANRCAAGQQSLSVPAGATLTTSIQFAPQSTPGC